MQAYVATYYGDPQLAKKDSAKIFTDDGGSFSKILQSDLKAEKIRDAYNLSRLVSGQVDKFKTLKRKRYVSDSERKNAYIRAFGSVTDDVFDQLDAAIPQITFFGMAALFEKHVIVEGQHLNDAVIAFAADPEPMWIVFVDLIKSRQVLKRENSWPTLLKAGAFYRDAIKHLRPIWQSRLASGR